MSDLTPPAVEIRAGRTVGHLLVVVVQLGLGGFFAVLAVRGMIADGVTGKLTLLLAAGMLALAFGAYHLVVARDRSVRVRLSTDGFTDFRSGGVTIPWDAVERIAYLPGHGGATACFHLFLGRPMDVGYEPLTGSGNASELVAGSNVVRVETTSLDLGPREFLAAVLRFAPHVSVDPLFAPRP